MSINQKLTNRQPDTRKPAAEEKDKKSGLDLSVTQILGGALAAVTAAVLGAQLSVFGTVIAAAMASIITAVGGSLYTASLRRTGDKVKTVFYTSQPNEVDEPTVMEIVSDREGHITGQRSHLVAPEPDPAPPERGSKLNWKRVVVATLAAFGIAAVALTSVELVTGHAISGGEGTTVQQVREGRSERGSDTKKEKAPSEKPTKEATSDATEESTTEPSAQASASERDETRAAPTPEASETTRAAPTPRASASGSP
ncbi:MAG TPA: hypothetical protein VJ625_13930 [Propionibacteriaceae bacterium]|nr:hypothetical protein [Propionibacteriaceae bacterium]